MLVGTILVLGVIMYSAALIGVLSGFGTGILVNLGWQLCYSVNSHVCNGSLLEAVIYITITTFMTNPVQLYFLWNDVNWPLTGHLTASQLVGGLFGMALLLYVKSVWVARAMGIFFFGVATQSITKVVSEVVKRRGAVILTAGPGNTNPNPLTIPSRNVNSCSNDAGPVSIFDADGHKDRCNSELRSLQTANGGNVCEEGNGPYNLLQSRNRDQSDSIEPKTIYSPIFTLGQNCSTNSVMRLRAEPVMGADYLPQVAPPPISQDLERNVNEPSSDLSGELKGGVRYAVDSWTKIGAIWGVGILAGFLGGLFGAGGPPLMFFVSYVQLPKNETRATLNASSLAMNFERALLLILSPSRGLIFSPYMGIVTCVIAITAWTANYTGNRMATHVSEETFKRIIICLLSVGSAMMITSGLSIVAKLIGCLLALVAFLGIGYAASLYYSRRMMLEVQLYHTGRADLDGDGDINRIGLRRDINMASIASNVRSLYESCYSGQ